MEKGFKHFATNAIHAAQNPDDHCHRQVIVPINLTTTFKQVEPGSFKQYDYTRTGNPTRSILEKNLATLENASYCRVFTSGLAAISSVIRLLRHGDHIVAAQDVFGGSSTYLNDVAIEQDGIDVNFVDFTDIKAVEAALKPNTKMVFFETPTNPLLKIVDIQAVTTLVKNYNKNILVVVDNTFLTPYFQRPLSFGVDIVVHSLTKYINGHTDVLMGAVMTNHEDIDKKLHNTQKVNGVVPSSFDCFLVIRSVKTLHVRMKEHMANALAIAKFLENHSKVDKVLYPMLESHPQHELHKKQTKGMSGIVSFYLKGNEEEVKKFVGKLKIFTLAATLGGTESLVMNPFLMAHYKISPEERRRIGVTEKLIRLSVGIEDQEDLIDDLKQALE
uniref:cystathionine gamma-lyase n=1 Tax=Acrobeloides nanus TaxID=290746 RepID=A0A914CYU4_9BILA